MCVNLNFKMIINTLIDSKNLKTSLMKKSVSEIVWISLNLQSQMSRWALTILFWVIYVWPCRDSIDFFSANLLGRAIYVWLCRDFDFNTEQFFFIYQIISDAFRQVCSAEQGKIFSLGLVFMQFTWSWLIGNNLVET